MFSTLDNADELMKTGRKEEAKEVIESWLKNEKTSKGVYQDAVAIYLFGRMYKEAKRVFDLYRQRHNKELYTDYGGLEDIEQEERKYNEAKSKASVVKIFKCKSFWHRARAAGFILTFFPIKEVEVRVDGIVLRKKHKDFFYKWADIKDVMLVCKQQEEVLDQKLILKAPDKTYKFDFTSDLGFSYFKDSDILLDELKKHFAIQIIKK